MGTIVRAHNFSDGAVARPDQVNANEIVLYNEINGNLDFANIKAALQNAANGFVKLDADAKVPVAQLPDIMPSGIIVMWSGLLANIPAGWSLCDGAGGTPDLREKFVMGAPAATEPGDTGGANSKTLAVANLPSHTHAKGSLVADSGGYHRHGIATWEADGGTVQIMRHTGQPGTRLDLTSLYADAHPHTISGSTASAGSGTAFDNRPAYYEIAFIQKD